MELKEYQELWGSEAAANIRALEDAKRAWALEKSLLVKKASQQTQRCGLCQSWKPTKPGSSLAGNGVKLHRGDPWGGLLRWQQGFGELRQRLGMGIPSVR